MIEMAFKLKQGKQVTTHFFSANPFEGIVRATWQHSRDASAVWGRVIGSSTDSNFVRQGAITWLLVQVKDVGAMAPPRPLARGFEAVGRGA